PLVPATVGCSRHETVFDRAVRSGSCEPGVEGSARRYAEVVAEAFARSEGDRAPDDTAGIHVLGPARSVARCVEPAGPLNQVERRVTLLVPDLTQPRGHPHRRSCAIERLSKATVPRVRAEYLRHGGATHTAGRS